MLVSNSLRLFGLYARQQLPRQFASPTSTQRNSFSSSAHVQSQQDANESESHENTVPSLTTTKKKNVESSRASTKLQSVVRKVMTAPLEPLEVVMEPKNLFVHTAHAIGSNIDLGSHLRRHIFAPWQASTQSKKDTSIEVGNKDVLQIDSFDFLTQNTRAELLAESIRLAPSPMTHSLFNYQLTTPLPRLAQHGSLHVVDLVADDLELEEDADSDGIFDDVDGSSSGDEIVSMGAVVRDRPVAAINIKEKTVGKDNAEAILARFEGQQEAFESEEAMHLTSLDMSSVVKKRKIAMRRHKRRKLRKLNRRKTQP